MRTVGFVLITIIFCLALLVAACDTGTVRDAQGSCETAAEEDRPTLEPNITKEIGMTKVPQDRL